MAVWSGSVVMDRQRGYLFYSHPDFLIPIVIIHHDHISALHGNSRGYQRRIPPYCKKVRRLSGTRAIHGQAYLASFIALSIIYPSSIHLAEDGGRKIRHLDRRQSQFGVTKEQEEGLVRSGNLVVTSS
jgi:hypothetical protein